MKFKLMTIIILLGAIISAMLFATLSNYSMSYQNQVDIIANVTIAPTPTPTPAPVTITGIGAISGTPQVGQTLTAGALTPAEASAAYQWQKCLTSGGSYADISGATDNTYTLATGDNNYYIKVVATGTDGFSGTATSAYKGPVVIVPITAIGAISGTAQVGQTLTAGALTPAVATATYQWQRCLTSGGTYANITGSDIGHLHAGYRRQQLLPQGGGDRHGRLFRAR